MKFQLSRCIHRCAWLALLATGSVSAAILPVDLRCESKSNPLGLSEPNPRLGWRLAATPPTARGDVQTAYQIQVAGSLQMLTNSQGDLWDTGKVATNLAAQIAYGGTALTSHKVCYWRVRAWDKDGQPSLWSAPASWTMGILNQNEWVAQWIGRDDAPAWDTGSSLFSANWIWFPEGDPASSAPVGTRWFRKSFSIASGASIAQAVATMAADNMFTLYVNGQIALSEQDPNYWQHHAQADISPFLVPGQNVLAVAVSNTGNDPNPAGLLGSLDVVYGNGQTNSLQTDGTWLAAKQLYANWNQAGYNASGWSNAMVLGAYGMAPWNQFAKTYLVATQVRKDFALTQTPSRAVLYVTGQGLVEPRLNGNKVGDEYFLPGWTDYAMRLYYRAYDVTAMLRSGTNTLGAILGDGWYRGNCAFNGQNYYGRKTRLRAQLHLFYGDGSTQVIASDGSWQAGFGPIRQADLQAGETYDARMELPGWDQPGFSSSTWTGATTGAEFTPVIQAHPAEPVRARETFAAVSIAQPQPGLYVLNFGQNIAGWARIQVTNQPAGRRIVLRFGEWLNPDGTVFRDNLRTALAMDTYICKGGGVEFWEPRFTFHGFQYLEVQGLAQPPSSNTVTAVAARTDLESAGVFHCSDSQINRIHSNMLWSVRDNYLEVPTDCPQRDERAGWCDGIEVMGTGLFHVNGESFFSKWSQDIVDSKARSTQSDYGHQAPLVSDDGFAAGWQDAVVFVPYYLHQTYGNLRPAERCYSDMVRHLNYYASLSSGYVGPDNGYGDWLAADNSTPRRLISTAFYARCAAMVAELAQALGKTGDAATYRQLCTNICAAFQAAFVSADGTVGTDSQGGYALALEFNLLTPAQRELAKGKLAAAVAAQNGNPSTGMVTTHLLLPALSRAGRADLVYQMLAKQDYPSWGFGIERGATTILELWNSLNADGSANTGVDSMNSLNHANFGACAEWFYRGILGINALAPGYGKILISPRPGVGLTAAEGYYDCMQGRISNAWTFTNGTFTLAVTIPPNTSAQIEVPTTNSSAITEGGVPAASAPGVSYLGTSNNAAVYSVGSGAYLFSSPFATAAAPLVSGSTNLGFELNVAAGPGQLVSTVPTGWIAFNRGGASDIGSQWAGGVDYTVNTPFDPPAEGNQYCYINMFNPSVVGGLYQDLGPLRPNTVYTLTVAIGSRADRINSPGMISLVNGTNSLGTVLASGGGLPATQDTWRDYSVSFATGSAVSGDLIVVLSVLGNGSTIQADFDNVRLIQAPTVVKAPEFGAPGLAGNKLVLIGSGGTPGAGYALLMATNLSAPIQWQTSSLGTLDDAGGFSNAIDILPSQPARFFRLGMR